MTLLGLPGSLKHRGGSSHWTKSNHTSELDVTSSPKTLGSVWEFKRGAEGFGKKERESGICGGF